MLRTESYPIEEFDKKHELVIGIVCAVGTDLGKLSAELETQLRKFSYEVNPIRLSNFLNTLGLAEESASSEFERVSSLMTAGNTARETASRGDFLALMAVADIHLSRPDVEVPEELAGIVNESEDLKDAIRRKQAQPTKAHILLTLKHPEEVQLLRMIYGRGFWLVGVYASYDERMERQNDLHQMSEQEFNILDKRDYLEEHIPYGQQTSKTFHLSDVFINVDGFTDLERFLDLIFGRQFLTPTIDEQAMFFAHAAAMRSSDLSRQVGTAILNSHNDLIAVGMNEVPSAEGGLIWPELKETDLRDYTWEKAPSRIFMDKLITSVAERFEEGEKESIRKILEDSEIKNLTEYGRTVHAEMEALMACARTGTNPRHGTIYTTLFPCHICAKHIIAAGIKRAVYIEPYPKSLALELLGDFIALEEKPSDQAKPSGEKVFFEPFVGIGPRRFIDLFSMVTGTGRPQLRKDKITDEPIQWSPDKAVSRLPLLQDSYLDIEEEATEVLGQLKDNFIKEEPANA